MKKIISLLLSTLIFASVFISVPVLAVETKTSGDFTYCVLQDGTAEIRSYNGVSTDVVIPEKIDGYTVTQMYNTFYCQEISSLVIPKTIKSILDDAMNFGTASKITVAKDNPYYVSVDNVVYNKDMTVLVKYAPGKTDTAFTVPSTVKTLANYSFCESYNLKNITLPDKLEQIGVSAFLNCFNLSGINIPSTVNTIMDEAFSNCLSITSVKIPEGVKKLSSCAFTMCRNLKTVTLPESLTYIGSYAFFLCSNIEKITIPKNVNTIEEIAFSQNTNLKKFIVDKNNKYFTTYNDDLYSKDMKKLYAHCLGKKTKSVTIPNGVTEISSSAFCYDESLVEVKIPKTVKEIGNDAFHHCTALKSIRIPEGIKELKLFVLNYCTSLKTVYLPKSITEIRENFSYTGKLTDIYFGGSKSMWENVKKNDTYDNKYLSNAKVHFNYPYNTSVTLPKYSGSVYVKGSYQLKPKVNNKYGTTTYKSANTKIAKVSSTGKITGVKAGKTTITVKNNGVSKKYAITVKKPKLNYTKKTIKVKSKFTIKVTGKVGTAKFSSSKKAIATVSKKGVVTAKKAGKTTITVTTNGMKLKCVVTVKKK